MPPLIDKPEILDVPEVTPPVSPSRPQSEPERITGGGLVRLADETKIGAVPLYYYADRSR